MHKSRSDYHDGYKAHVVVEPLHRVDLRPTPHTRQPPDGPVGVELMENEPPRRQVLADAAYGSGETRVRLRRGRHRLAIKPWPVANTGRFGHDVFSVDHAAGTVTCLAGRTVFISAKGSASFGNRRRACQLHERGTTRQRGRALKLRAHDAEFVEARRAWRDGDFAHDGRRSRPMVERSLAWLVRPGRRVGYRRTARNRIWLAHRAAAVKLQRLITLALRHDHTWRLAT